MLPDSSHTNLGLSVLQKTKSKQPRELYSGTCRPQTRLDRCLRQHLLNSDFQTQPHSFSPLWLLAEVCGLTLIHSSHAFQPSCPSHSLHPMLFERADRCQIMSLCLSLSHFLCLRLNHTRVPLKSLVRAFHSEWDLIPFQSFSFLY